MLLVYNGICPEISFVGRVCVYVRISYKCQQRYLLIFLATLNSFSACQSTKLNFFEFVEQYLLQLLLWISLNRLIQE